MRSITSIAASLPLSLWAIGCLAVEDARKPPQADPWGIAIFVGLLAVALGWLAWRVRSAARKNRRHEG